MSNSSQYRVYLVNKISGDVGSVKEEPMSLQDANEWVEQWGPDPADHIAVIWPAFSPVPVRVEFAESGGRRISLADSAHLLVAVDFFIGFGGNPDCFFYRSFPSRPLPALWQHDLRQCRRRRYWKPLQRLRIRCVAKIDMAFCSCHTTSSTTMSNISRSLFVPTL